MKSVRAYHSLIQELPVDDSNGLKSFLKIDMASFNELFEMVTPLIKRRDTLIRNSISSAERLALTLSFSATGELIISIFKSCSSANGIDYSLKYNCAF